MKGTRAVVCAFLVAVVACGGTTPTTSATSAASTAPTTTASPAPTSAAATSPAASAAASGPRLSDLLAGGTNAQYKISYKATTAAGDTVQTWYVKPPKSRFDFVISQGGQQLTISYFSLPDGTFYCFNPGQAQCLKVSGVSSPLDQNPFAVANRAVLENPAAYGATFASSRTIAGQTGQCFDVRSSATVVGFSTGTFCYTSNGVPLLSQFSAQGQTFSMEATSYSATVPDSDFELPARPLGN